MSDEDFLKRWSRRKRDLDRSERAPSAPASDAVSAAASNAEADFDPTTLPPIESITALSDVTAFLRKGVPAELTLAALRHAWTADPAIRDFVGLAENAWDFTDPNAMPGFGPLEMTDEVRRMIARVVGEIGQASQSSEADTPNRRMEDAENSNYSDAIVEEPPIDPASAKALLEETQKQNSAIAASAPELLQSSIVNTAPRYETAESAQRQRQLSHRVHGGALPR